MASLKKKITIKAQKVKPKKADDFTVNTATGKRTLSGAEASRRLNAVGPNKVVYNKAAGLRAGVYDTGAYESRVDNSKNLPVSSGGKRKGTSFGQTVKYFPAGTRTKRERGR
jgi:hypothetical protein